MEDGKHKDISQIERLQRQKSQLNDGRRRVQMMHYMIIGLSITMLIAVPILIWQSGIESDIAPILVVYMVMPLAVLPYSRGRLRDIEQDLQTIEFEIDLLQFEVNPRETRAEKILRINNLQLQRYYNLNLKMHASASSHLGSFHSRLVETHQLLLGNLLASRIEDDTKRWETLSQLALNIVMSDKGKES